MTITQRRRRIIPAAIVICLLAALGIWRLVAPRGVASQRLTASGTIEARETSISPEIGGRVRAVLVEEGEAVTAGQALIQIDDAGVQAQLASAQASLRIAQASYDLLAAGATDEQMRQAQAALDAAQARYDGLRAGARSEQVAQAEANLNIARARLAALEAGGRPEQIAQARASLAAAQATLDQVVKGPTADDIALAKLAIDQAKNTLWAAQASRDGICGNKMSPAYACDAADAQTAVGETGVQVAQQRLAQLQAGASQETIAKAQSAVDAARAQLSLATRPASEQDLAQARDAVNLAEAQLALIKSPVTDTDLAAAEAQVAGAQAQVDALKAGARPEQLAAAQAQVDLAQAQADAIQVQLKKLALVAPSDGVILTRSIEPGEMAAPGATLLLLGNLASLELTVYLPEEKYPLVSPGEQAQVRVDAYPGRDFAATVLRVADRAEFTPRNVQTVQGRKDTVFAVRLSIANLDLALKPGLPADVTFGLP